MGPTSVDVGGPRDFLASTVASSASMGPTSVDVGGPRSEGAGRPCGRGSWLQWGRHQSMSEGVRAQLFAEPRRARCFNGADISRCRRACEAELRQESGAVAGFNGADISRCRRAQPTSPWRGRIDASMGPTSVDVGGSRAGQKICADAPRFNGADISRCRRGLAQNIIKIGLLQGGFRAGGAGRAAAGMGEPRGERRSRGEGLVFKDRRSFASGPRRSHGTGPLAREERGRHGDRPTRARGPGRRLPCPHLLASRLPTRPRVPHTTTARRSGWV